MLYIFPSYHCVWVFKKRTLVPLFHEVIKSQAQCPMECLNTLLFKTDIMPRTSQNSSFIII